ncbi:enoyl-CoA hydratase/isomerase family protein [Amycolatopsis endophytica]|uniref:Enoyl-CoA hydratase/carnithine racemase n=1 Tax=Amycolatopsis endophytica TaxID=860233 RepID=A0A853B508_9PSEU|nr:enoyl-CoA hydratase/isomerase family protein [Amycolatopsis endophytica]NYI89895.1 enoyl-CoA hydratase/carnithine racemase [Amycolatopsis endophytica]
MTEVVYETRASGAWIRINRPEAMNSLSVEVLEGIIAGLEKAREDEAVRAVVLTGTGKAFCAGADLKKILSFRGAELVRGHREFLACAHKVFDAVEMFPKPVISAVNGLALAGGLELILCGDLVIASETAKLGDAHANYGLLPGGGASVRLPRTVGPTMANYLFFTGEFLPASRLVACGLVNEVVPADTLETRVAEIVEVIATKSPVGLARLKQLVRDGMAQEVPTGVRLELLTSEAHAHSEDFAEGLTAFKEGRSPVFPGR